MIEPLSIISSFKMKLVKLTGSVPEGRANACGCLTQEDSLVLVGGNNGSQDFADVHLLDIVRGKWSKMEGCKVPPIVGSDGQSVKSGNTIKEGMLFYGGWTGEDYSDSLYLLRLDK